MHMRPAGEIMKVAISTTEDVTIRYKDTEADAKSVMSLMLLLADFGDIVEVSSKDADVVDKIEKILQTKKL